MIYEKEIETLQDYIKEVETFSMEFCLSRGQEQDYELLPGALRCDGDGKRLYSKTTGNYFLNDFKLNSTMYMDRPEIISTEYDYMVLAQHYGVPTRLLDFTYSHMVSLMFAVEKAFSYDDEKNSVVWFLNPYKLNQKALNRREIVNISENGIKIEDKEIPIAISTNRNNSRILAQNGMFVFFQHEAKPLEKNESADEYLKKIIIPHCVAKNILKSLYLLGMRFSNIYPELSSISKDIILKNDIMQFIKEEAIDGK